MTADEHRAYTDFCGQYAILREALERIENLPHIEESFEVKYFKAVKIARDALLRAGRGEKPKPETPVGDPYNGWRMTHDGVTVLCAARDDTWEITGIGRREGPVKFYRIEPLDGTIAPLGEPAASDGEGV